MSYKVVKESRLPQLDWEGWRDRAMRSVNQLKHYRDQIYYNDQMIWFWHDHKRKRVALIEIQSIRKVSMHGFGKMISLHYYPQRVRDDAGDPISVQLVNVDQMVDSPEEIVVKLTTHLETVRRDIPINKKSLRFADRKTPVHDGQKSEEMAEDTENC